METITKKTARHFGIVEQVMGRNKKKNFKKINKTRAHTLTHSNTFFI